MPTYEYECQKCGIIFEKFQKMSDEPIKKCPECNGAVKKIPSLCGGIIFKGKGFYSTDNKSSRALTNKSDLTNKFDSRNTETNSDKSCPTKSETSASNRTETSVSNKAETSGTAKNKCSTTDKSSKTGKCCA